MTKAKLIKSNERKNVAIFILIAICFVLAITVSCQYVEIKNLLEIQSSKTNYIIKNAESIIDILTIGEENGD